jgi:hypothetical protein
MLTEFLVGGIACPLQSPDLLLLNLFLGATSRVSFMKTFLETEEDLVFQILACESIWKHVPERSVLLYRLKCGYWPPRRTAVLK